MNWLDILLIIIIIICGVFGIISLCLGIIDSDPELSIEAAGTFLITALVIGALSFLTVDKKSGSTIGIITSIDRNFFGTTAIYIKTSETNQEEYCIEDKKVVEAAKELIGKNVKIEYGTRVGLYSTGKCSEAPVEKIELIEEK